jgi:uncharacterized integral membrane protein
MTVTPEPQSGRTPELDGPGRVPAPYQPGRLSPEASSAETLSPDLLPPGPVVPAPEPRRSVARTRTSAAWLGVWAGVVVLILLIIFVAQNTDPVEITFLWMHGSLPLALALLIAGVGAAIVAMGVAAARITQLRRLLRKRG